MERKLPELSGLQLPVREIRFEPGGESLVTTSEDGDTQIWDVWTGQCLRTTQGDSVPGGKHYVMEQGDEALGETVTVERRSRQPVAWFPLPLPASSDGTRPRWYGHRGLVTNDGEDLYVLSVEVMRTSGKKASNLHSNVG